MATRTHSSDGRCIDHGRLCCGTCLPDLNNLGPTSRFAIFLAVRREVFRDDNNRVWRSHSQGIEEASADVAAALADLEAAGLLTCPRRASRARRYFEITDKTPEA